MPLLDHFHPPLYTERHWESFHARWSAAIADGLNARLPRRYFAEQQTHVGSRVEIDVATFDYAARRPRSRVSLPDGPDVGGGTAVLVEEPLLDAPPAPVAAVAAVYPDSVEVLVYSSDAGPTLVAAVELVSPGNKDRPEARQAFVAKCATYLRSGVGVAVIDIVTNRRANLHNELLAFLGHAGVAALPEPGLFASAYRPARNPRESDEPADRIEVWTADVAVGGPLPRIYLPLDNRQFIALDLEATYTEARVRTRLG